MHDLNEDVEKAMKVLSELSTRAKRLGSDSVYYASNRAWWQLYNLNARAQQESKDA